MILFYILLEDKDCISTLDDCNKDENTGEVCENGKCKCGAVLCRSDQKCVDSVCSMYLKSNNPNKIINTKLKYKATKIIF